MQFALSRCNLNSHREERTIVEERDDDHGLQVKEEGVERIPVDLVTNGEEFESIILVY